jgi:2',3'-cyclic-nucleotide 2'-phosphodiesterase (5'-nucleotidase family)
VLRASQAWLQGEKLPRDEAVAAAVEGWEKKLDKSMGDELGYSEKGIPTFWPLSNLLCRIWLESDPKADFALVNQGGIRQNLDPGLILRRDILGALPFDDLLYRVTVKGSLLRAYLKEHHPGIARAKTGKIQDAKDYSVLLNNFMYNTNAALKEADPHPVTVWTNWRDPVELWFKRHPSSPQKPIDSLIDSKEPGE